MKEILNGIFKQNGFEKIQLDDRADFWANYEINSTNFYLVLYIKQFSNEFLVEDVPLYYDKIKKLESGYDERIDKNLSMLVVINIDDLAETEGLSNLIYEIEEDPYYFKKYVFVYDNIELNLIKEKLGDIHTDPNMVINEVVTNTEVFYEFKQNINRNSSSLYSICSKLMIKIPFLKLLKRNKQLDNLNETINKELDEKNLLEFKNKLYKLDDSSDEFIENLIDALKKGEVENENR